MTNKAYLVDFLCSKSVGCDKEYIETLISKCETDDQVLDEIFRQKQHKWKSEKQRWIKEKFKKLKLLVPFRKWFIDQKLSSLLDEISLFEMEMILAHPLYMFHAHKVPIKACTEFAQKQNITIPLKALSFSVGWEKIESHPMCAVPQQEMIVDLKNHGLELDINYKPFGPKPLENHELEFVDINEKSSSELELKFPWQRMEKIREKKTCEIKITLNDQKEYVIGNISYELALLIVKMLN